eukprot:GABV01012394.1.p1 GENE.GABV01012394.1~~GABV01012394.1.p1  ORF type:complete len:126 (-),score=32.14 GABV01012394.1:46-375(-)
MRKFWRFFSPLADSELGASPPSGDAVDEKSTGAPVKVANSTTLRLPKSGFLLRPEHSPKIVLSTGQEVWLVPYKFNMLTLFWGLSDPTKRTHEFFSNSKHLFFPNYPNS